MEQPKQTEEETDSDPESEDEAALAAQIDTSAPVTKGSRIAVVSKSVDGEYWKALHSGMEDAIKDVNAAYGFTSDDQITMTFEGASDEQDVEKQVNTLDAVIAENPTVLCLSAGDEDSCQAQLEAARENDIAEDYEKMNLDDDDVFQSKYFMDLEISKEDLREAAQKIMEDPACGSVFRIKGFTQETDGSWTELNATHHEITLRPIEAGQKVIIVIGEHLEEEEIRKYLEPDKK